MDAKKIFSVPIVAILLLPALFAAFPLVSATITERPVIYYNGTTADPLLVPAGSNISIWTGNMTITGAQVWLWLSASGSADANQADGDRWYAGPFYMGDVVNATPTPYTITPPAPFNQEGRNYTYTVGDNWINGTVPLMVQGGVDYWVKITDVNPVTTPTVPSSDVGVSTSRINFEGGFLMTPVSGAPDTPVTVSGSALPIDMTYNITQNGEFVANVSVEPYNESGWLWTGFTYTFPVLDLKNKLSSGTPPQSANVTIAVVNEANSTMFTGNFTEYYREVYVDNDAWGLSGNASSLALHGGNYSCTQSQNITFSTGGQYNISLWWFPYNGQANIYLNSILVASGIALNESGAVGNYTITIPEMPSGSYTFRVIDNNNVEYNFTVCVVQVPTIDFTPDEGGCGDEVTLTFTNMADWIGEYVTVWFNNTATNSTMLANLTVPSSSFNITVTVPHSAGGERYVFLGDINGTPLTYGPSNKTINTTFLVTPKVWVDPASFSNDGLTFWVYGCGFNVTQSYFVNVDNQLMSGLVESNDSGDVACQLVKAGFRPGMHAVSFYSDDTLFTDNVTIYAYATFTVAATGDLVTEDLMDYMNSSFSSLNATVINIQDGIATVQTTLGLMQTSIENLNATVINIQDGIATVQTTLGQINGTVTSINGNVATVKTDVGTIKAEISSMEGFLPVDMTPVWIAVVLALIAAIASIYGIFVIRSKIAA